MGNSSNSTVMPGSITEDARWEIMGPWIPCCVTCFDYQAPLTIKTGQHLFVHQKPSGYLVCFLQLGEKPLAFCWWIFLKPFSILKEGLLLRDFQSLPSFSPDLVYLIDFYPPAHFWNMYREFQHNCEQNVYLYLHYLKVMCLYLHFFIWYLADA